MSAAGPGDAARPASRGAARGGWRVALDGAPFAVVALTLAMIATAGAIGLIEPTETRYAEIARELHASGEWLVPRLDGISHFHKPPLAYWLTAAGFSAFGVNEWGARIPVALASMLTLVLTALAVRRRFGALAIRPGIAVWTLGSCAAFFTLGRTVATDPFLTASVAAFWAFAPSPWAIVALALGFLAKGPVVLVPTLLPVLAARWLRPRGSDAPDATRGMLGPAWSWSLFALIGLGWYLMLVATRRGLLSYLLENQIWARYTTTEHHRPGPAWYFVAVLLAGALPWTVALTSGLVRAWRARADANARLLLAWLLVPLAFFSFSGSKLPAYYLTSFPAAALLAAWGLEGAGRVVRGATAALLAGVALGGWIAGPAGLARLAGLSPPAPVPLPPVAHAALVALALAALAAWRARPAASAMAVTLGLLLVVATIVPYERRVGTPRGLVKLLAATRGPNDPVIEYARFHAGLPFYLGETVRLLEVPRESGFDDPAAAARIIVNRDSVRAWLANGRRVWVLGPGAPSEEMARAVGASYAPISRWREFTLGLMTRQADPGTRGE